MEAFLGIINKFNGYLTKPPPNKTKTKNGELTVLTAI
jgi:hypothetical protein